jgi:hypothetical protein
MDELGVRGARHRQIEKPGRNLLGPTCAFDGLRWRAATWAWRSLERVPLVQKRYVRPRGEHGGR